MGHGAQSGHAELPVRHHTGGTGSACNIGGASAQNGAVSALGPAGAKLHHSPTLGSANHAAGLGGDQALVVDGQQDHGLDELGLDDRAAHRDDGLAGEDDLAFGNGPHVTFKFEIAEIVQKALGETTAALQIGNILLGKAQILQILHHLLHAGHNGVTAVVGDLAEKHIEICDGICHAVFKIAVGHGQLIKVGEHRQVLFHVLCLLPAKPQGFARFAGLSFLFLQKGVFTPHYNIEYRKSNEKNLVSTVDKPTIL